MTGQAVKLGLVAKERKQREKAARRPAEEGALRGEDIPLSKQGQGKDFTAAQGDGTS